MWNDRLSDFSHLPVQDVLEQQFRQRNNPVSVSKIAGKSSV